MPEDKAQPAEQQGDENTQISSSQRGVAKSEVEAVVESLLGHPIVDRFVSLLEKKVGYDYDVDKERNANEKQNLENAAHHHRNVEYHLKTDRFVQYVGAVVGVIFVGAFFSVLFIGIFNKSSVQWGYIPLLFAVLNAALHYLTQYLLNKNNKKK